MVYLHFDLFLESWVAGMPLILLLSENVQVLSRNKVLDIKTSQLATGVFNRFRRKEISQSIEKWALNFSLYIEIKQRLFGTYILRVDSIIQKFLSLASNIMIYRK